MTAIKMIWIFKETMASYGVCMCYQNYDSFSSREYNRRGLEATNYISVDKVNYFGELKIEIAKRDKKRKSWKQSENDSKGLFLVRVKREED